MDDVSWPTAHPAIRRIALDGSGNLYVIPVLADAEGHADVPVDVYSPEGALIVAGRMANRPWIFASGDYVYTIESDAEVDEDRIVRYTLTLRRPQVCGGSRGAAGAQGV